MVGIIDYGAGNIGSITNMINYLGGESKLVAIEDDLLDCEKYILPGVGSFDHGMSSLKDSGLIPAIEEQIFNKGKKIMGICLGAQLFTKGSEEGKLDGLGWLDAQTKKFVFENKAIKIPHMGWNTINIVKDHPLLQGLDESSRFYFVHSYYIEAINPEQELTSSSYGHEFSSSLSKSNIAGFQFHPEKSHKFGLRLMSNFLNW